MPEMQKSLLSISTSFIIVSIALAGCNSAPSKYSSLGIHPETVSKKIYIKPSLPKSEELSVQGNRRYYRVHGKRYEVKAAAVGQRMRGTASWYGKRFHKKLTSNGEIFDMQALTAAHKTLPLPSYVRVTNLSNGKSVDVRVNDRGPFRKNRVIDLSYRAAKAIDMVKSGVAEVRIEVLQVPKGQHKIKRKEVFIQVASYQNFGRADKLVRKLKRKGVDAFVDKSDSNNRLHRVKVGPLLAPESKKVQATLKNANHRNYILVR